MDRAELRRRLLMERDRFVAGPDHALAETALADCLTGVLHQLEPRCLGLYWPIRSEFNAVAACARDPVIAAADWALPHAVREPPSMHYRHWDRRPPTLVDEAGVPSCEGAPAQPDVVLLPCVGYTAEGFRLGYGAGFFDRWLAVHQGVTAVGVAWSGGLIASGDFVAQPHDAPLMLVVTERGVIG
jgi:5-formyltetrahydrofolate cyclo-ligase